jgi:hypothetical protein
MPVSEKQRTFTNPLGDPSRYTSLHLTAQFRDKSLTVAAFLGYLREDILAQGALLARGGTPEQIALARHRIDTSRKQLCKLGGEQEG